MTQRSLRAPDWSNFFLSDVRDGIGPYLGVYLLAAYNWDAGSIGMAMAAIGFLFLSGWAVVAFLVFYFGVPETRPAPAKS